MALMDLASGRRQAVPSLPGELVLDVDWSLTGTELAMTISRAAVPPDIWILEVLSGRWRQVTHSSHPGVDLSLLVRPQLVQFPAHDGLELSGWLYHPHDYATPGPGVLDFRSRQLWQ